MDTLADSRTGLIGHEFVHKVRPKCSSGCSPGLGGCTSRCCVCLDDMELFQLLFRAAEDFCTCPSARRSDEVTMTALHGRWRRATSFQRLVANCLARQFGKAVESACAPFQFALSTRAGNDFRVLTDENPMATVLSIDGIGAHDHVHRSAMLKKGYASFRPCNTRRAHDLHVERARGPSMPLLFSLAIHAFRRIVSGQAYDFLGDRLATQPGIRLHTGKTRVWNGRIGA